MCECVCVCVCVCVHVESDLVYKVIIIIIIRIMAVYIMTQKINLVSTFKNAIHLKLNDNDVYSSQLL